MKKTEGYCSIKRMMDNIYYNSEAVIEEKGERKTLM
jgi:hypothetical protein